MSRSIIKSLAEFVSAVLEIHQEWSKNEKSDNKDILLWFRGHEDETYKLLPGIYRSEEATANDENYQHDFRFMAHPYLAQNAYGTPENADEWYFLMQHFGLPTRLLDWTGGSLIALHFAIFKSSVEKKINPCVWILHPFRFNKILHGIDQIYIFPKDVEEYVPSLWKGKRIPKDPMVLQPVLKIARLAAQRGQFTIHGSMPTPLENIKKVSGCLDKIVISYKCIDSIKRELYQNGVTESMLFPDLEGLCREIKDYYRWVTV